jgi:hypothetical protein
MPTFITLLFNIVLKNLARTIRQEKQIKDISMRKEDVKLFTFSDDMILHIRKFKYTITNVLEL